MINQTEQMMYRLNNLDTQYQKNTYQKSTGEILQNGSDDSVLYARVVFIDDKIRTFEGLENQVEKAAIQNNAADSSMKEIKKILDQIKYELIKANTDTTGDDGKAAISTTISGLKENLYQLANTQVENQYVFSGSDSSVKPFEKNVTTGKVTYVGDNQLKKIAVEEGSYRESGITGFDMMFYSTDSATKSDTTLTFTENQKIFDQNGDEWKLNVGNTALVKYDSSNNATSTTKPVTSSGTPAIYSFDLNTLGSPIPDGTKFEAKTNIFDFIDDTVNALKKVDSAGNPITDAVSKTLISKNVGESKKAYDGVNVAHSELGGKNKIFEISLERISSKLTQYNILSQQIGAADLTKVAVEAKSLELTYTALYSTISKTNELSLVNFLK